MLLAFEILFLEVIIGISWSAIKIVEFLGLIAVSLLKITVVEESL
jgi:hypothetical protein